MAGRTKGKGGRKPSRPLSEDDVLQAEATEAARDALMALFDEYIKDNFNRPMATLDKTDFAFMAHAAIVAWLQKRAEQAKTYGNEL